MTYRCKKIDEESSLRLLEGEAKRNLQKEMYHMSILGAMYYHQHPVGPRQLKRRDYTNVILEKCLHLIPLEQY